METSTDKPIICYHRRSKNKNGANLQSANLCCISKSAISHKNKNGAAAAAAASDQRRKGLFKNSEKPVICFHRNNSSIISKSDSIITSHTIRDAAPLMEAEEKQQQQQTHEVVSPMGVKRKRMSVVLPDEIIHNEILTRLPAKYIVRSRLVCKSWNSLLFNSQFVKSHLARLHTHPYMDDDEDLIIAKSVAFTCGIHILSRTNQIQVPLVPPFYATFLGSINGLVCMSSRMENMFRVWNPAIAQFKQFFLPSQHPKDCKHFLGGFSWDHMQNDYKVVLVCHDTLTSSPSQLIIYSTNSATWTQLPMPDNNIVLPNGRIYKNMYIKPPSTFVKGIPYWRYTHYLILPGKKRRRKFISAFKFLPQNNEFRLLPDLDSLTLRGKTFNIVDIKDCLVGMAYKRGCEESLVDIYSLDEETHSGVWSKMYTIGPIDLSPKTWRLSQCFKNGGEILIIRHYSLVSLYDPKTKQTKVLEGQDDFTHKFSMCFSYTPSLVCVQGMVSIHQFLKNRDNEISFDDFQAFNCA